MEIFFVNSQCKCELLYLNFLFKSLFAFSFTKNKADLNIDRYGIIKITKSILKTIINMQFLVSTMNKLIWCFFI